MFRQQIQFIIILIFIASCAYSQEKTDLFEKGVEEKKSGDWSTALTTWMEAWSVLQDERKVDPRFGIAFIETVTEQKLGHFYGTASDMYLWGFSSDNYEEYSEVFNEEVSRIIPLVGKEKAKDWESDVKNLDSRIVGKIREFWIMKDPTPKTSLNERLIEHWERISFARTHYTKRKNSVYETDDRGLIYVKYGKPHTKASGELHNEDEFRIWISNTLARASIESKYSTYPTYEVWVYNNIWGLTS